MSIRQATKADLPAILEIYREGTRDDRSYDYPKQEVNFESREKWFDAHSNKFPIFVYEENKQILGFVSLNQFDPRPFLAHVAEVSMYVKDRQRGKGIGTKMFKFIFDFAKKRGIKKIIAVSFTNNPVTHLEKRMGFEIIGTYKKHVHRGGNIYYDLHILEKHLI